MCDCKNFKKNVDTAFLGISSACIFAFIYAVSKLFSPKHTVLEKVILLALIMRNELKIARELRFTEAFLSLSCCQALPF